MKIRAREKALLCSCALALILSMAVLPLAAAETRMVNPSVPSGSAGVVDSGFSETLGPITIGDGELVEMTTVAPEFADNPYLPDVCYPGELTVTLERPIVIESGGELSIGTLAIGGPDEASPVLKGTLSQEGPLILVKAGGSLTLRDVECDLEGEGLLIEQEPGGVVQVYGKKLDESLVSWNAPVVNNLSGSGLPEDVWLPEGETLTAELLPQEKNCAVLVQGGEEWKMLALRWDLSAYDGRTAGELTLTGEYLDEQDEPLLAALPLTVTVHWYGEGLLVTDVVWQGREAPSVAMVVPNLPQGYGVGVRGEVSEDGGETWAQWTFWDAEERFSVTRDTDGTPICIFSPPDNTPRLYRVCAEDFDGRTWSSEAFLLPDPDDAQEDQGGNRGGGTALLPPDREPAPVPPGGSAASVPSAESEEAVSELSASSGSAAAPAGSTSSAAAASSALPPAAAPVEEPPVQELHETALLPIEPNGVEQANGGEDAAPPAYAASSSAGEALAQADEQPLPETQSAPPAQELDGASAAPLEEPAAVSDARQETTAPPPVGQFLLVAAGLAACVVAGMAFAGAGPFSRRAR